LAGVVKPQRGSAHTGRVAGTDDPRAIEMSVTADASDGPTGIENRKGKAPNLTLMAG